MIEGQSSRIFVCGTSGQRELETTRARPFQEVCPWPNRFLLTGHNPSDRGGGEERRGKRKIIPVPIWPPSTFQGRCLAAAAILSDGGLSGRLHAGWVGIFMELGRHQNVLQNNFQAHSSHENY
eukprot:5479511-Amphidinium_carterae.6